MATIRMTTMARNRSRGNQFWSRHIYSRSHCVTSLGVASHCVTSLGVVSQCVMSEGVTSHCVTSLGVASHCLMSLGVTSHCLTSLGVASHLFNVTVGGISKDISCHFGMRTTFLNVCNKLECLSLAGVPEPSEYL
jgi:hypothetical protein